MYAIPMTPGVLHGCVEFAVAISLITWYDCLMAKIYHREVCQIPEVMRFNRSHQLGNICHFKNSSYISYGEAIKKHGFEVNEVVKAS